MRVRKVQDPMRRGRECFQWGHSGRVYCGAQGRERAAAEGKRLKEDNPFAREPLDAVRSKRGG